MAVVTFMNAAVADYPDQEIHVILDNLKTHKPKRDAWLTRHKNVHLHFTPTHASWLNQVEIWFSILVRNTLKGASFSSVARLRAAINAFIESYNQHAEGRGGWSTRQAARSTRDRPQRQELGLAQA